MLYSIKYPGLRYNLLQELETFTDKKIQKKEWCSKSRVDAFWGNATEPIECIFDVLPEETSKLKEKIGIILKSNDEAKALKPFIENLNIFCSKVEERKPDFYYLNSPLWDDVVEAAKHAHEVLMKDEDLDALLEAEEKRVVK